MPAKNPNSNGGKGQPNRASVVNRATGRHEKHLRASSYSSRCESCNPRARIQVTA